MSAQPPCGDHGTYAARPPTFDALHLDQTEGIEPPAITASQAGIAASDRAASIVTRPAPEMSAERLRLGSLRSPTIRPSLSLRKRLQDESQIGNPLV
jgi:hypothetical protein